MCYSKMTAGDGGTISVNPSMAMAQELLTAGQNLEKLLTVKPELFKNHDIAFLKVFGEVVSEVGLLFKGDDVEQKLQQLLAPLKAYTGLMPYFLLIKSILENVQRVIDVDWREHKDRLQWVNKELIRIAVEAAAIARKLEDLGKSLIDIIKGPDSKKATNHRIFNFHYHQIYFSLTSCITDMELVKCKIDDGLSSIEGYKKKIKTIMICGGIFAILLVIMAPVAGGCLGVIAAYGILEMIALAAVPLGGIGAIGACFYWKAYKAAKKIQQCYIEQNFNWEQLNEKLKTMKEQLELHRESRKLVDRNT